VKNSGGSTGLAGNGTERGHEHYRRLQVSQRRKG
jgi:hypothetical protein